MPDLASRVVAALQRNPALAWEVAQNLLVLGPWVADRDQDGKFWYRAFPNTVIAISITEVVDEDGSCHYYWSRRDVLGETVDDGGGLTTPEEAFRAADDQMVHLGYILRNA
jgi:hypothetical protein